MSEVHQCPFCELRYQAKWELSAHLEAEHPGRVKEKDRDEGEVIIEESGDSDPNDPKPL